MGTAHRDAGRTRSQGIDTAGATLAQTRQRVMHGQAVEQIATDAVEGDDDRRYPIIHGAQILHELTGRDPPITNLAVHEHFDGALFSVTAGLHRVPALVLYRHPLASLVVNVRTRVFAHV
ncbi:hypothetical protein D3C84_963690 [compost metagenome]